MGSALSKEEGTTVDQVPLLGYGTEVTALCYFSPQFALPFVASRRSESAQRTRMTIPGMANEHNQVSVLGLISC